MSRRAASQDHSQGSDRSPASSTERHDSEHESELFDQLLSTPPRDSVRYDVAPRSASHSPPSRDPATGSFGQPAEEFPPVERLIAPAQDDQSSPEEGPSKQTRTASLVPHKTYEVIFFNQRSPTKSLQLDHRIFRRSLARSSANNQPTRTFKEYALNVKKLRGWHMSRSGQWMARRRRTSSDISENVVKYGPYLATSTFLAARRGWQGSLEPRRRSASSQTTPVTSGTLPSILRAGRTPPRIAYTVEDVFVERRRLRSLGLDSRHGKVIKALCESSDLTSVGTTISSTYTEEDDSDRPKPTPKGTHFLHVAGIRWSGKIAFPGSETATPSAQPAALGADPDTRTKSREKTFGQRLQCRQYCSAKEPETTTSWPQSSSGENVRPPTDSRTCELRIRPGVGPTDIDQLPPLERQQSSFVQPQPRDDAESPAIESAAPDSRNPSSSEPRRRDVGKGKGRARDSGGGPQIFSAMHIPHLNPQTSFIHTVDDDIMRAVMAESLKDWKEQQQQKRHQAKSDVGLHSPARPPTPVVKSVFDCWREGIDPFLDAKPEEIVLTQSQPPQTNDPSPCATVWPLTGTLRRCWDALRDTVDAFSAVWDGDESSEHTGLVPVENIDTAVLNHQTEPNSALCNCDDIKQEHLASTPQRHQTHVLETQPSRPRRSTTSSRPSHFDSLNASPITSRSSKRRRKPKVRRSHTTPVRSRQKFDVDHTYSTDDDPGGLTLLEKIFHQGPPHIQDERLCVFTYSGEAQQSSDDKRQSQLKPDDADKITREQATERNDALSDAIESRDQENIVGESSNAMAALDAQPDLTNALQSHSVQAAMPPITTNAPDPGPSARGDGNESESPPRSLSTARESHESEERDFRQRERSRRLKHDRNFEQQTSSGKSKAPDLDNPDFMAALKAVAKEQGENERRKTMPYKLRFTAGRQRHEYTRYFPRNPFPRYRNPHSSAPGERVGDEGVTEPEPVVHARPPVPLPPARSLSPSEEQLEDVLRRAANIPAWIDQVEALASTSLVEVDGVVEEVAHTSSGAPASQPDGTALPQSHAARWQSRMRRFRDSYDRCIVMSALTPLNDGTLDHLSRPFELRQEPSIGPAMLDNSFPEEPEKDPMSTFGVNYKPGFTEPCHETTLLNSVTDGILCEMGAIRLEDSTQNKRIPLAHRKKVEEQVIPGSELIEENTTLAVAHRFNRRTSVHVPSVDDMLCNMARISSISAARGYTSGHGDGYPGGRFANDTPESVGPWGVDRCSEDYARKTVAWTPSFEERRTVSWVVFVENASLDPPILDGPVAPYSDLTHVLAFLYDLYCIHPGMSSSLNLLKARRRPTIGGFQISQPYHLRILSTALEKDGRQGPLVNDFALHISRNPDALWMEWVHFYLKYGLRTFAQLATIRARAWQYQEQLSGMQDPSIEMLVPWNETGYDWKPNKPRQTNVQDLLGDFQPNLTKSQMKEMVALAIRRLALGLPKRRRPSNPSNPTRDEFRTHENFEDGLDDYDVPGLYRLFDRLSSIRRRTQLSHSSEPKFSNPTGDSKFSPAPTLSPAGPSSPARRRDFTPPKASKLRQVSLTEDDQKPESSTVQVFRDYGKQFDRPDPPPTAQHDDSSGVTSSGDLTSPSQPYEGATQDMNAHHVQDGIPPRIHRRYPSIPPASERPLFCDVSSEFGAPLARAPRMQRQQPSPQRDVIREGIGLSVSRTPQDTSIPRRANALNRAPSRRLVSSDLIPDRFRYETASPLPVSPGLAASITTYEDEPQVESTVQPRLDSITEDRSETKNAHDCPPLDSTTRLSQRDKGRRAAAVSDSDVSIASSKSTGSSRARKALAYTLNTKKDSWSPNVTKSNVSVGSAVVGGALNDMVNLIKPSNSKSLAEGLTMNLSKRASLSPSKENGSIRLDERSRSRGEEISDIHSKQSNGHEGEQLGQVNITSENAREIFTCSSLEPTENRVGSISEAGPPSPPKSTFSPKPHDKFCEEGAIGDCGFGLHGNARMSSHAPERKRSNSRDSPPPRTALPEPPNLSKEAKLTWRTEDELEDILNAPPPRRHRRSFELRPLPPPTPRIPDNLFPVTEPEDAPLLPPLSPKKPAPEGGILPTALEELVARHEVIDGQVYTIMLPKDSNDNKASMGSSQSVNQGQRGSLSRFIGQDRRAADELESSERTDEQRRREQRSRRNMQQFVNTVDNEGDQLSGGDSSGPLKPLTPLSQQQLARKSSFLRRRAITMGKLEAWSKEETDWMTDDPQIRNYAAWSQNRLYGAGEQQIAHTPMLQPYPAPNHDIEEINKNLRDMTVNDHNYQLGGPPTPVNVLGINYLTDVSGVRDYAQFQQAREAKVFSGYALFTERQEEIGILRRLKIQGVLKDDIEIKYGYQEKGPHGSVAWLTHAGQEIGGRQREEYERERAIEEARKQAEAEAEYYQWLADEQNHHSEDTSSAGLSELEVYPLSQIAIHSPRPVRKRARNFITTRNVVQRCESDESIKTAYRAGETVPHSAYRDLPDFKPELLANQSPKLNVLAPADASVSERTPDPSLTAEE
ncbi:hypothetical protein Q7P37_004220 [Cladosporium fusiforme]